MQTTIGHNSNALEHIVTRAKQGLEQVRAGEEQTIEGWLVYGAALNDGREMFPSDEQFGKWVRASQLETHGRDERAAAMWAAANPEQFRETKKANPCVRTVRGLHAKFKEEPRASSPQEKKPRLDKDDRRKIDKLRKVAEDPATPEHMRESVEAKLKGYQEAHGKNYDDYINMVVEDEANEERPYVDTEYVAREIGKVVLNEQYDYDWRLAQIQDWLELAFDDDDKLMREFNWIMTNKEEPDYQAA